MALPSVGVDRAAMDELHEMMKPAAINVRLVFTRLVGSVDEKFPKEALVFEAADALHQVQNRLVVR